MNQIKSNLFVASLAVLLTLSTACGRAETSQLNSGFNTFASSEIYNKNSCDITKHTCRFEPLSEAQKDALEQKLGLLNESLELDEMNYVKVVDITREDIEAAKHSCAGNRCVARFEKNIPLRLVSSKNLSVTTLANIKLSYLKGSNADKSVTMHRVAVSGESRTINIKNFLKIEVDGGVYFDNFNTAVGRGVYDLNFFLRANITSEIPYFSLGIKMDREGISISTTKTKDFRDKFLKNRLPVKHNAKSVRWAKIKKDFIKNVKSQSKDPHSDKYWDQFGERLIVLDGY